MGYASDKCSGEQWRSKWVSVSLIEPASTWGCAVKGFIHSSIHISVSDMLPLVLRSFPNSIFQGYSVSQCFNCVSNDDKMQLRFRSFTLRKSNLMIVPKLRFLYWHGLLVREGRKGMKEARYLERNKCFSLASAAATLTLKVHSNSHSCYLDTQVSMGPGCGGWKKNLGCWPTGTVSIGKGFLTYLEL